MLRFCVSALLLTGLLASCTPRTSVVAGVTVTPVLIKVSQAPARGGALTVQGRFLGGPSTGRVIVGADEDGAGGSAIPAASVQSWTDTEIVLGVPQDAPVGGSWLYVEVNGKRSTGLRVSIKP
ncbi:hypothetical protein SAMN04488058_11216 [Deinococcus reticulitermitis]|uniref:IPT/TIG domain-containing protein n=1 Tax=Deinococcus reticulitermitis TaxID=856736 RepID=A0A1H7AHQ0_9DEIO|nr:cell surface protein [Deinococcus reticulitermitis]SEJ61440.1 hypothetical protein SAMN04488058_11216 [Deinococcus reticulitermitis]